MELMQEPRAKKYSARGSCIFVFDVLPEKSNFNESAILFRTDIPASFLPYAAGRPGFGIGFILNGLIMF